MNDMADATQLNLLGIAEGTDKTLLGNDYLTHYARLFAAYKDAKINVLEIGVSNGGSLRTWQKWFTQATIIGIDIELGCRAHAGDRMIVEIGSQADPDFLLDIAKKYPPSIIIDDGSHVSDYQIISLECLFQTLPPGGIYVIEDMFFQANPATAERFGGTVPLAIDYLTGLARDRASWAEYDPAQHRRRAAVGHYMGRIEFFSGCAALFRHDAPTPPGSAIEMARSAIDGASGEEAWRYLFNYAIRYNDAETAHIAAAGALKITGDQPLYGVRMDQIAKLEG